jgi:methylmalonyl-CoA mutase N-terminal domain/subunit
VQRFKRDRSQREAREALARVRAAAAGDENLMEPLVAAVRAGCTVGEVCDVYRAAFGEYRDPAWL